MGRRGNFNKGFLRGSHPLMGLCTCVIDNLYGDKNGSHGASMGWGQLWAATSENK
jgi:hypothetical protein